jgi:hypothetical protein
MAYLWLQDALNDGLISLNDLQVAASHGACTSLHTLVLPTLRPHLLLFLVVLTMKFAAGLFDSPITPEEGLAVLNSPPHRQLALEAARQGVVLALNANNTLPLSPPTGYRIAMIGPMTSCNFSYGLSDPTPTVCHAREAMVGAYALDNGASDVPLLPEALEALLPWAFYCHSGRERYGCK